MKSNLSDKHLRKIVVILFLLIITAVLAMNRAFAQADWAKLGTDNKLIYKKDANGNRIMDFSYAGYMGGGVALPNVPVKITVNAATGDRTAAIQNAINQVAAMPLVDGFRGAVLLGAGTHNISATLNINATGVVVRGSGSGTGGTVINMTGTTPFRAFLMAGSGSPTTNNTVNITGSYVPSGTHTFTVNDASNYQVGNSILIYRTVTQAWIEFVGMDNLVRDGEPQTWIAPGTKISTDRIITAINGNTITIDAPLTDSFDATYLGTPVGTVAKYSWPTRISQCGLEDLKIQAPAGTAVWGAATIDDAIDCWMVNVVGQNTQNAFNVSQTGKRITLEKVVNHNSVTQTATAATADFSCTGAQVFVNKCESTAKGIWPMIAGARGTGPIAVLNFKTADRGVEPHQRWTTGFLSDNCIMPNATSGKAGISYRNRSTMGSGHGWCTAWSVAWNCETPYFLVSQAPGTYNWAIGGHGNKVTNSDPQGIFDHFNSTVTPSSLYLQQLLERLGPEALANIGYGSGVAPSAPTNLIATAISSSQINLSWTDNSSNESNFSIERSTNGGSTWSLLTSVGANTTTYSNTGLDPSTIYHYRVRATNASGNSAYSNIANATTQGVPVQPTYQAENATIVQGVVESNHIGFNGTGFVNYNNVVGSYVEWDLNVASGGTYNLAIRYANASGADRPMSISVNNTVTHSSLSFPVTAAWTSYTTVVFTASLNAGVNTLRAASTTASGGPNVDELQVNGLIVTPPAAPGGLTATAVSASQIDLNWTDNSNNETQFRIERSTDAGATWSFLVNTSANATTFSNTGLAESTTFHYRVRAENSGGNSAFSNVANTTTLASAPASPSGLTITGVSSNQMTICWTDNAVNETGFRIERSSDGISWAFIATVNANTTCYTDSGLTPLTTYHYRVRAENTAGGSAFSNTATATTTSGTTLQNVALNKSVTASGSDANVPANAVDGDNLTRWSASPMPQWLEVDLGGIFEISKTEVISYQDRAYQFLIEAKTTSTGTYSSIVDRRTSTTPGSIAAPITNTFPGVNARYVRITVTGASGYTGTWASIIEFRVFGTSATTQPDITLEAESGTITSPLIVQSSATASGGQYITVTAGNNSNAAVPANGHATYNFSVSAGGSFKVWGRVTCPTNSDDSFWVRVDNGTWINWNNITLGTAWTWDDVHDGVATSPVTFNLSAGQHTLEFAYREDGALLDKIIITDDLAMDPNASGGSSARKADPETPVIISEQHVNEMTLSSYPNPPLDKATVKFFVPVEGQVKLSLYNTITHKSVDIINENVSAGYHQTIIDVSQLPLGIHVIRLTQGRKLKVYKLIKQ